MDRSLAGSGDPARTIGQETLHARDQQDLEKKSRVVLDTKVSFCDNYFIQKNIIGCDGGK
jgi:hypothetical protein